MSRKNTAEVEVGDALNKLGLDDDGEALHEDDAPDADDDEAEGDDEDDDEGEGDDESARQSDVYDPLGVGDRRTGPLDRKPRRPSKLREALFDEQEKRRRIAPPPPAPRISEAPALHPLAAEPEVDPVVVIRPDRIRKERPQPPPNTKKLGALAKKLPGAERIRIMHRQENGQLGYVGDYSLTDLSGSVDVETFIARHVKPKFGPGTYKVIGIDATGAQLDGGEVVMLDPVQSKEDGALQLITKLLESQQQQARELMEQQAARANGTAAPDPINMLEGLHRVHQGMVGQQPANTNGSDIAAMMSVMMQTMASQQQQTMQMMAQQAEQSRQQQQAMTQVLVEAMRPKEDTATKALLAELIADRKAAAKESSNIQPLPMPPPPPSPLEGVKEIVGILAEVMRPQRGSADDEIKELVKSALAVKDQNVLSPRDVIQIMNEMKSDRGTDDFRKSMENMSMMLQVANNLRNSSENTSSAGIFDALAALFSNRDFAGSIAQSIRSKSETQAATQRMQAEQQMLKQRAQLLNQVRQERVASGLPPAGVPVGPGMPVAPGMPGAVVPIRPAGVPTPQQVHEAQLRHSEELARRAASQAFAQAQRAESAADAAEQQVKTAGAPKRPELRLPPIPSQTGEHIGNMAAAPDAAGRVQAAVTMMIYWAEFDEFRPLVEMVLGLVKSGDKRDAITLTRKIFDALSGMAMMPPELGAQVAMDFADNFDEIQAQLADLQLDDEDAPNPFEGVLGADEDDEDGDGPGDDDDDDDDEEEEEEEEDAP